MAYTVKQVAAMSGISVRTLHFYDETGLLKPAYTGSNGYRFYEEPQLLTLQQILFYRELGFELKEIKRILGRADFEKVTALQSHRDVLQKNLDRTRSLIETVDKTIEHLQGTRLMTSEELFQGFTLAAGEDRFGERIEIHDLQVDCKLSADDTDGAVCIFEVTSGWPRHSHREQDEWIYVIEGELVLEVDGRPFRAGVGESIFLPRQVPHSWSPTGKAKIINIYQPAGRIEDFFHELRDLPNLITAEQVYNNTYTEEQVQALRQLFDAYGMDLLPPKFLPSESE
jgi:DNA-binding transcriptional MerR regulator